MNDKARITVWLSNDTAWLTSEKNRIERQTNNKHLCQIVTNGNKQALFYSNGYFENGMWTAEAAGK